MTFKTKLTGLLAASLVALPALLPGVASAQSIEVAGVQTTNAGQVSVCTFNLQSNGLQTCFLQPVTLNGGSEVAGVQVGPDQNVEVAGVQLTDAGPVSVCTFTLLNNGLQVCLLPSSNVG